MTPTRLDLWLSDHLARGRSLKWMTYSAHGTTVVTFDGTHRQVRLAVGMMLAAFDVNIRDFPALDTPFTTTWMVALNSRPRTDPTKDVKK